MTVIHVSINGNNILLLHMYKGNISRNINYTTKTVRNKLIYKTSKKRKKIEIKGQREKKGKKLEEITYFTPVILADAEAAAAAAAS